MASGSLAGVGKRAVVALADADPTGGVRRTALKAYARLRTTSESLIDQGAMWRPLIAQQMRHRNHDTMFILGSGASVEDLRPENFLSISKQFSVGINGWVVHDYIPSVYAFERIAGAAEKAEAFSICLGRPEVRARMPGIWATRAMLSAKLDERVVVPLGFGGELLYYSKMALGTANPIRLTAAYADILSLYDQSGTGLAGLLPGVGASIDRMAAVGILAGFSDVVFVGVDLKNSDYFWERNPEYLRRRGILRLESGQAAGIHKTDDASIKRLPVSVTIEAMSSVAASCVGTRFWVASSDSKLHDFLDVYPWPTVRQSAPNPGDSD